MKNKLYAFFTNETFVEIAQTIFVLLWIGAIISICFALFNMAGIEIAKVFGYEIGMYETFAVWYIIGIGCSLYWPIKFRAGMAGQWGRALSWVPFISLGGPLAFILGCPM